MATSTRPCTASPLSSVTGAAKLSPASALRASLTVGVSPAPVYQATTASAPCAAIAGPLTGHAVIVQLSACTGWPGVQAVPS